MDAIHCMFFDIAVQGTASKKYGKKQYRKYERDDQRFLTDEQKT